MLYEDTTLSQDVLDEISALILEREAVSTLWLPGTGRTSLGRILQEKKILEDYDPDYDIEKLIVIYLDQDMGFEFMKEHILGMLRSYGDYDSYKAAIFALIREGYEFVFAIDNFRYGEKIIKFIISLRNISIGGVSFVFLSLVSDFEELENHEGTSTNFIFHNVIRIPLIEPKEAKKWMTKRANQLKVQIPNKDIDRALELCGGIASFMNGYLRNYKRLKNHDEVMTSKSCQIIVKKAWTSFSKSEKQTIRRVYIHGSTKGVESGVIKYLQEHRLIDSAGKIRGKWVDLIKDSYGKINFEIVGKKILWEGFSINEALNPREQEFLRRLLTHKGVISRDDTDSIISTDMSNDWTIDKFVSRIRKKLKDIGITVNIIETVRGKGYRIRNVSVK